MQKGGGFFFFELEGSLEFLDLGSVIALVYWGGGGRQAVVFFLQFLVFEGKAGELMEDLLREPSDEVFEALQVWLEFRVVVRSVLGLV